MKTAVITGVTGQDGRFLTKLLLSKNYHVIGLVSADRLKKIDLPEDFLEVDMRVVNFSDTQDLGDALRISGVNEFYNLVASSSVKYSFDHPLETAEITALAPIRILDALRKNKKNRDIKFYQASSSEMYGNGPDECKTEHSKFFPASPYAVSKVFAHQTCQLYKEAYGMFISCGILFNHESPYRSLNFVSRKISNQVARLALGKQTKIVLGTVTPIRDWGYAADYVEAMWQMLQQEIPDNYVIASGQPHSVLDFVTLALDIAGIDGEPMSHIEISSDLIRPIEINASWGDYSKAKEILKWEPTTSFKELVTLMLMSDMQIEENL